MRRRLMDWLQEMLMLCETDIDIDKLGRNEVEGVIKKEVTRNIK